jgi:hypothetical protein
MLKRIEGSEFYKSITTYGISAVWQDVYRTHYGHSGIYIKC